MVLAIVVPAAIAVFRGKRTVTRRLDLLLLLVQIEI
jgi:hypothetical protein